MQAEHVEVLPARQAKFGTTRQPLPPQVQSALTGKGISQLFSHQVMLNACHSSAVGDRADLIHSRFTDG